MSVAGASRRSLRAGVAPGRAEATRCRYRSLGQTRARTRGGPRPPLHWTGRRNRMVRPDDVLRVVLRLHLAEAGVGLASEEPLSGRRALGEVEVRPAGPPRLEGLLDDLDVRLDRRLHLLRRRDPDREQDERGVERGSAPCSGLASATAPARCLISTERSDVPESAPAASISRSIA